MKKRKVFKLFCVLVALATGCVGCGSPSATNGGASDEGGGIDLLEPKAVAEYSEKAACRNLYDVAYYTGKICAYTEEYSFDMDVAIGEWKVCPGDQVSKGSVLVTADTSALEEAIQGYEERLSELDEEFETYRARLERDLVEPRTEEERLKGIVEAYERVEPPMYGQDALPETGQDGQEVSGGDLAGAGAGAAGGTGGEAGAPEAAGAGADGGAGAAGGADGEKSAAYLQWEEEHHRFEGQYRLLAHQNATALLQLEQRTKLWQLEREYLQKTIRMLQGQFGQYSLASDMDGEVMAMKMRPAYTVQVGIKTEDVNPQGLLEKGTRVERGHALVAVGDRERIMIRSEYIDSAAIREAKRFLCIIQGKSYEVAYQPLTEKEIVQIDKDEQVYTTFNFLDEDVDVPLGENVYIILEYDSRANVLTVPADSVHKQVEGSFVYQPSENGIQVTRVVTGMSDGVYTEILSGLKEGDPVVIDKPWDTYPGRLTLEKSGWSISYGVGANFFFPVTHRVVNPVEHGTVFFEEWKVNLYQQVEKGDVLAMVRVQKDDLLLERQEARLQRMRERLDDLAAGDAQDNADAIEDQRKSIQELEKEVEELRKDYETTKILAPVSGLVIMRGQMENGTSAIWKKEQVLPAGVQIVEIAEMEECYIRYPDLEGQSGLSYGQSADLSYAWRSQEKADAPQEDWMRYDTNVLYAGKVLVSEDLRSDSTLFKIPPEMAKGVLEDRLAVFREETCRSMFACELEEAIEQYGYDQVVPLLDAEFKDYNTNLQVHAGCTEILDTIILSPQDVLVRNGQTYVLVEEDGEVVARSFMGPLVPFNREYYYWVLDGLEEGDVICTMSQKEQ